MAEVLAFRQKATNADLMVACRELGYIDPDEVVLDMTYGKGTFWRKYRPGRLLTNDIDPETLADCNWDFRSIAITTGSVRTAVLDPPYKLNGTANRGGPATSDVSYGVGGDYASWQAKHALIKAGIDEAARLLKPGGHLLLKCMDQVCSGEVRWQTFEFTAHAEDRMLRLVDRMDLAGHRKQPPGRRQLHARRNHSTLLIFKKL